MAWLIVLVFLAVTLSVVAGYFVFVDLARSDEARARERIEEFRKDALDEAIPALFKDVSAIDLGEFALARPEKRENALTSRLRRDWLRPLRDLLARSGLKYTPAQILTSSAVLGLLLFGVGLWSQGLLLAVPALLGGAAAPVGYVEMKRRARRDRFLTQLPGAFELMARIIRSGQSVPQSFQAVADSFEEPIAAAFGRCREQQNLGLPPEVAFQELAEQVELLEMRIFVMAMLIQRQVGGNLSEVLERLAGLVRERDRLRRQVRTLTAEGRMQAVILLVLPFAMFLVMRFVNRDYADVLLEHVGLLAAMCASLAVGALWIRKIVNFEV